MPHFGVLILNTVPSWIGQSAVLAQRFFQDEQDRTYVPERACQGNLEKLPEFGEYAQAKGRLKVFCTEFESVQGRLL